MNTFLGQTTCSTKQCQSSVLLMETTRAFDGT